jgi:hypothetical protein
VLALEDLADDIGVDELALALAACGLAQAQGGEPVEVAVRALAGLMNPPYSR